MPLTTPLRHLLAHVVALATGALVAGLAPPSLLPPLFLFGIAVIALLAIAAHKFSVPVHWGPTKKLVAAVLILGIGPSSMDTRSGSAPKLFLLAICVVLGFVLFLVVDGSVV